MDIDMFENNSLTGFDSNDTLNQPPLPSPEFPYIFGSSQRFL